MANPQGFRGFPKLAHAGGLVRLAQRIPGVGDTAVVFDQVRPLYDQLIVLATIRGTTDGANTSDVITVQFNGDTGSNYAWSELSGDGSSPVINGGGPDTWAHIADVPMGASTAGDAVCLEMTLPFYAGTTLFKQIRTVSSGILDSGPGYPAVFGGSWQSAAAITTITLALFAGGFDSGSIFVLYGLGG